MKAAYIQGPDTLLKDTFRKSAEEALASFSLAEFPVAIKQILLYIRSTVENFGTVGAQNKPHTTHIVEYANSASFPSSQFSKDVGASVLRTFMEILEKMVIKLQGFQEAKISELAVEKSQEGSDLFLELNQSSTVEVNIQQVRKIMRLLCFFFFRLCNILLFWSEGFFLMKLSFFRSFFQLLAPSLSIHIWSSGFWLWSYLPCLLTL